LDLASADAVYDLLADAVAAIGATLLLVTHDQRAARIADRVVRIRDGRLSEQWTPDGPEFLVVDDRGWVRLPEQLRRAVGAEQTVRAHREAGRIVLQGAGEVEAADAATAPAARNAAAEPDATAARGPGAYGTPIVPGRLCLDG